MRLSIITGAVLLLAVLAAKADQTYPQYYDISDAAKAQAEARERHLPLAWLGSSPKSLTDSAQDPDGIADLTQMAVSTLQGRAVIVFFNGNYMVPVPPIIHEQFHQQDDGTLPNGGNWVSPTVVFSDAEISKTLGRVSYTQMKADRDVSLNSALQVIRNNPTALTPVAAPTPVAPVPASGSQAGANNFSDDITYGVLAVLFVVALVCFGMARSRPSE